MEGDLKEYSYQCCLGEKEKFMLGHGLNFTGISKVLNDDKVGIDIKSCTGRIVILGVVNFEYLRKVLNIRGEYSQVISDFCDAFFGSEDQDILGPIMSSRCCLFKPDGVKNSEYKLFVSDLNHIINNIKSKWISRSSKKGKKETTETLGKYIKNCSSKPPSKLCKEVIGSIKMRGSFKDSQKRDVKKAMKVRRLESESVIKLEAQGLVSDRDIEESVLKLEDLAEMLHPEVCSLVETNNLRSKKQELLEIIEDEKIRGVTSEESINKEIKKRVERFKSGHGGMKLRSIINKISKSSCPKDKDQENLERIQREINEKFEQEVNKEVQEKVKSLILAKKGKMENNEIINKVNSEVRWNRVKIRRSIYSFKVLDRLRQGDYIIKDLDELKMEIKNRFDLLDVEEQDDCSPELKEEREGRLIKEEIKFTDKAAGVLRANLSHFNDRVKEGYKMDLIDKISKRSSKKVKAQLKRKSIKGISDEVLGWCFPFPSKGSKSDSSGSGDGNENKNKMKITSSIMKEWKPKLVRSEELRIKCNQIVEKSLEGNKSLFPLSIVLCKNKVGGRIKDGNKGKDRRMKENLFIN